ncbi:wnk kinase isoform m [Anaeramoeba flamelloides]|uniref:Wnk kinase isoform m n=1 Tax=Anaeramoeba flamelloides TaxID=1746091 RepID=A0AAV8ACA5_9EUKA|nr:wnk kinase isoform m [Anaeramoeba flamelloides]
MHNQLVSKQTPTTEYIKQTNSPIKNGFKRMCVCVQKEKKQKYFYNQIGLKKIKKMQTQKFETTFALIKKLCHPNLVKVIGDYTINEEQLIYISEYFKKGTLSQYLKTRKDKKRKKKLVQTSTIRKWCLQILKALDFLHSQNPPITHKAITPQNIYLTKKNELKIGEIGLLDLGDEYLIAKGMSSTSHLAPEFVDGSYNHKIDVYSFGLCVLEMATLERPFQECSNSGQYFQKLIAGELPQLLEQVKNKKIKNFIELCLKPKEERPTVKELLCNSFIKKKKKLKGLSSPFKTNEDQKKVKYNLDDPNVILAKLRISQLEKPIMIEFELNIEKDDPCPLSIDLINKCNLNISPKIICKNIENIIKSEKEKRQTKNTENNKKKNRIKNSKPSKPKITKRKRSNTITILSKCRPNISLNPIPNSKTQNTLLKNQIKNESIKTETETEDESSNYNNDNSKEHNDQAKNLTKKNIQRPPSNFNPINENNTQNINIPLTTLRPQTQYNANSQLIREQKQNGIVKIPSLFAKNEQKPNENLLTQPIDKQNLKNKTLTKDNLNIFTTKTNNTPFNGSLKSKYNNSKKNSKELNLDCDLIDCNDERLDKIYTLKKYIQNLPQNDSTSSFLLKRKPQVLSSYSTFNVPTDKNIRSKSVPTRSYTPVSFLAQQKPKNYYLTIAKKSKSGDNDNDDLTQLLGKQALNKNLISKNGNQLNTYLSKKQEQSKLENTTKINQQRTSNSQNPYQNYYLIKTLEKGNTSSNLRANHHNRYRNKKHSTSVRNTKKITHSFVDTISDWNILVTNEPENENKSENENQNENENERNVYNEFSDFESSSSPLSMPSSPKSQSPSPLSFSYSTSSPNTSTSTSTNTNTNTNTNINSNSNEEGNSDPNQKISQEILTKISKIEKNYEKTLENLNCNFFNQYSSIFNEFEMKINQYYNTSNGKPNGVLQKIQIIKQSFLDQLII